MPTYDVAYIVRIEADSFSHALQMARERKPDGSDYLSVFLRDDEHTPALTVCPTANRKD